jgi:hypothetical protein
VLGHNKTLLARTIVYLGVIGFGPDPAVVTELVGLTPTRAWAKGEPIASAKSVGQTHSRWELHSPLVGHASVEEQLDALLALLEPRANAVRNAAKHFEASVRVLVESSHANPSFHFTAAQVQRLSSLNLALDADFYVL